jgi:biofilm protein TabA
MIIDTLANAERYYGLHKNFKAAFEYLNSHDLSALEDGKFDIAEGLKAIVSNNEGKTAEVAGQKFECHNKNIDIQVCIHGNETIGWKPRKDCTDAKDGGYNEEKDVTFFNHTPDMYFGLKDNQFVIFFPEDVHAPMIGEGLIKKLVVKVKI